MEDILYFESVNKGYWILYINSLHNKIPYNNATIKKTLKIKFASDINKDTLEPCHLVLLGCFLEFLDQNNYDVELLVSDEIHDFMFEDLQLYKYFNGKVSHVEAKSEYNNNLWKIETSSAIFYSNNISKYLKNTFFKGCDLSPLQVTLDELYGNIGDHAGANGIAYSFVKYDVDKKVISVAFCDFGCGIPTSLRNAGKIRPEDERSIIKRATEIGVSAKTNSHNRGMGLDTVVSIISDSCYLSIVSNNELFFCKDNRKQNKTFLLDFDFKGTLIYFKFPISSFEKEEFIDESDLFTM